MANPPVVTIDETGIHVPEFADSNSYVVGEYQAIYGSDIYLETDSQDGQFLSLLAFVQRAANAMAAAVYNAFSPATAQGAGLSSVVKINGIARHVASFSSFDARIVGVTGSIITNGSVVDDQNNVWRLPFSVTIPLSGEIIVTATCAQIGAVDIRIGSVLSINTPTRGWQAAYVSSDAAMGSPIETDAALRLRQASSTMIPSLSVLDGIVGAVLALDGVTAVNAFENDTNVINADGIPQNAFALVILGGDDQAIGNTIANKKSPGVGTYGSTSVIVTSPSGIVRTIRFFRPTDVPITFELTVKAFRGYTILIENSIKQALSDWVNKQDVGTNILLTRTYSPANLYDAAASKTYEIIALAIARDGNATTESDIPIVFYENAECSPDNVIIHVVTS